MISDIFKIIMANAKHIEIGFLTNKDIMILTIDCSLIDLNLIFETLTSTDHFSIYGFKLDH